MYSEKYGRKVNLSKDELFRARMKAENIVKEYYEDYNIMEADAFIEGYLVALQYN